MKLLGRIILSLFLLVFLAVAGVGGYIGYQWSRDLPSLDAIEELRFAATTRLYARDGTPIGALPSVEDGAAVNRTPLRLAQISPAAVAAVVASEDYRFFEHYGVDWIRLAGAIYYILQGDTQGGSTLTMQLVRNTVLQDIASQRTAERKFKEILLALELERRYTKPEILEMYLNVVFWGGNAAGIGAAAQAYFDQDASELTLAQGAYLAGLLPSPNTRYEDLASARERLARLVGQMEDQGWITAEQAARAVAEPVTPLGWQTEYSQTGQLISAELVNPRARIMPDLAIAVAPHFLYELRRTLNSQLPRELLFGEGGLTVYTSLDPRVQAAAEQAAREATVPRGAQLAMVGMDPANGQVLALIGALPGTEGEFNRASQAWRSPGSSIKAFVYATAFEAGWNQATTIPDAPVSYPDPSRPGGYWRPRNFSGSSLNRPVTLRYAFDLSLNLPAIRTAEKIGVDKLAANLLELGFRVPEPPNLAIAIGAVEITPVQLAAAYSSFLNGGYRVSPQLIDRVEDQDGNVVYRPDLPRRQVWQEEAAYMVWDMMKGYVVDRGAYAYGRKAQVPGRVVGGKTGTSQDARDLWYVGASPGFVGVVWAGRDDYTPMTDVKANISAEDFMPQIWQRFAEVALQGWANQDLAAPAGVSFERRDLNSGKAVKSGGINMAFSSRALAEKEPADEPKKSPTPPSGGLSPGSYVTLALDPWKDCIAGPEVPPERVRFKSVPADQVERYRCE